MQAAKAPPSRRQLKLLLSPAEKTKLAELLLLGSFGLPVIAVVGAVVSIVQV